MSLHLPLGAPGVYRLPDPPFRELTGVRMDVCAFVGVAPRGPAREAYVGGHWYDDRPTVEPERPIRRSVAVPVESWTDYVRLYGAFEGPGRLPHAVAAFLENGGRRAYVVRIVHEYGDRAENMGGRASARLEGVNAGGAHVTLVARNEGEWGNGLRATLSFTTHPLPRARGSTTELDVHRADDLVPGTLVRITQTDGARTLHWVRELIDLPYPDAELQRVSLTVPTVNLTNAIVEVVTGDLEIDDGDGRLERHVELGLSSEHPRWIATTLCRDSYLLLPEPGWSAGSLLPSSPLLRAAICGVFQGGRDRWDEITPDDFLRDPEPLRIVDVPENGIACLEEATEVALLVAPDVYEPATRPITEPVGPGDLESGVFEECIETPPPPLQATPLEPLRCLTRDPRTQLVEIVALQQRVIDEAEQLGVVALLDVPPGLSDSQILHWRRQLWSSYAAAYHPWVRAARAGQPTRKPTFVNPSAVAAGIVARRELTHGITWGPGNELAVGIVDVADRVDRRRHDDLHQNAINVLLRACDGVRLTAARTLSSDRSYRQLSVRRLVTMLERTLARELDWTTFEPHSAALRADVRSQLDRFLRVLYREGAFRGATEDEAFFVRCDEELNPRQVVEAGRLIAEIRIAPAEPIEFLVLRIVRGGDGTLTVEDRNG